MYRHVATPAGWSLTRHLVLPALAILFLVSGCAKYRWTYDDAFPPEPLDFPRWDPPDTLAFFLPDPPPVESVILDAKYYYLIHPPGEEDFYRNAREREARAAREREAVARQALAADGGAGGATVVVAGGGLLAAADSTAMEGSAAGDAATRDTPDSLAAGVDSLAAPPDTAAFVPPPPVQVDLSEREKDVYRRRAMVDLERAESLLVLLDRIESPTERDIETTQSVRGFIQRAQNALDREDFLSASNLALKARTLAEDAYESRP